MLTSKSFQRLTLSGLSIITIATSAIANTPQPLVKEKEHNLVTATYLGGTGENRARAIGHAPQGRILAGGNFTNLTTAGQRKTLAGVNAAAKGKLLQLAPDGRTVLSSITLGDRIDTLQVNSALNRVVVGGDFGVVVLNATSLQLIWKDALSGLAAGDGSEGQQTRVSMNNSGRVAVLRAKRVMVFAPIGTLQASTRIMQANKNSEHDYVTDVAIGNRVYVVGYSNQRNGLPVQVPFLQSLDPDNNLQKKWHSWDFAPNTLSKDMADGRLYRVIIGGDNKLAVLGESAGGNSMFRWNGKDLKTNTKLVATDAYNTAYNTSSNHILYYAKLDADTGEVTQGQFTLTRIPSKGNKGNTVRAKDGTFGVDRDGNVYVGGISAFGIAERDLNRVAGQTVAPYAGSDMYLLTVSADFRTRIRWTPFAKNPKGGGTINALAIDNNTGNVALFGSVEFGSMITTPNALQPNRFNSETGREQDAYFSILKTKK
jgi:hypothetical protein